MANSYFQFKQFTIHQDRCAMKVTTDACLFGAWVVDKVISKKLIDNSVLDIGTGTGLLALMLAQKNQQALITGIEIEKDAAMQAKENISKSPWKDRIDVVVGNVKDYRFPEKFELIISNPPFYENEIPSVRDSKNVAHHSRGLALKELLVILKDNLTTAGSFYLLLPYKRNEEIKKLFTDHQVHIDEMIFVRQSVNHDYFRVMIKGSFSRDENVVTKLDEMSIWDAERQYTAEFVRLLKDYYLYL